MERVVGNDNTISSSAINTIKDELNNSINETKITNLHVIRINLLEACDALTFSLSGIVDIEQLVDEVMSTNERTKKEFARYKVVK